MGRCFIFEILSMETFEALMKKSYDFDQVNYNKDWRWQLLAELYDKNFIQQGDRDYNTLPKKIHQIWLGSEIPDEYRKLGDTWKRFNPDWEYRLWTDKDAKDVDIPNRELYESLPNFGQKSDYLRYHILNQFGGIYADTDFECLKSFNTLSYTQFFISVGYPSNVELYQGLIGCIPNHPVMLKVMDLVDLQEEMEEGWMKVFNSTGGYFFTRCFFDVITEYTKGIVALPPAYFFPFPNEKGFESKNARDYIQDCSYALHYWELSWLPPKLRKKRNGLVTG